MFRLSRAALAEIHATQGSPEEALAECEAATVILDPEGDLEAWRKHGC